MGAQTSMPDAHRPAKASACAMRCTDACMAPCGGARLLHQRRWTSRCIVQASKTSLQHGTSVAPCSALLAPRRRKVGGADQHACGAGMLSKAVRQLRAGGVAGWQGRPQCDLRCKQRPSTSSPLSPAGTPSAACPAPPFPAPPDLLYMSRRRRMSAFALAEDKMPRSGTAAAASKALPPPSLPAAAAAAWSARPASEAAAEGGSSLAKRTRGDLEGGRRVR